MNEHPPSTYRARRLNRNRATVPLCLQPRSGIQLPRRQYRCSPTLALPFGRSQIGAVVARGVYVVNASPLSNFKGSIIRVNVASSTPSSSGNDDLALRDLDSLLLLGEYREISRTPQGVKL